MLENIIGGLISGLLVLFIGLWITTWISKWSHIEIECKVIYYTKDKMDYEVAEKIGEQAMKEFVDLMNKFTKKHSFIVRNKGDRKLRIIDIGFLLSDNHPIKITWKASDNDPLPVTLPERDQIAIDFSVKDFVAKLDAYRKDPKRKNTFVVKAYLIDSEDKKYTGSIPPEFRDNGIAKKRHWIEKRLLRLD